MARTAVIAGTATAVSGGVQRRQAERAEQAQQQQWDQQQQWAAQQQAAAPAPAPAAAAPAPAAEESVVDQLTKLADLKAQGILSDEEFEAAKAKVLAS
jgi:transcription initiation factor TFIID subunit TAF12